jgi:UDP-glucose/iron transport system ATP-binding protein
MIHLANITISRGGKTLLKDVDLKVANGTRVAICGPSGCGKSSLLAAIVGCFPVDSGQIFINDLELKSSNVMQIRQQVAFIGQEPIMGAETVREAMLLPFSFHANNKHLPDEQKLISSLESLMLTNDILDKTCISISGGERQRVAIARALLMHKKIFIADELTSALDKKSTKAVEQAFEKLEVTLISVSHDPVWLSQQTAIYEFDGQRLKLKTDRKEHHEDH